MKKITKLLVLILTLISIQTLPATEQEGILTSSSEFGLWERTDIPFIDDSAGCFDILNYSDTLFVATSEKVLLFSINNGLSWEIFNNSMIDNPVYIRYFFRNTNIFAAILSGNNYYIISSDGGISWKKSDIGRISVMNPPINDGIVFDDKFILATDNGLIYTTDFGESWESLEGGELDSGEHTSRIIVDENNSLYVSTLNGLLESKDNGLSWKIIISKESKIENNLYYCIKVEKDIIYAFNGDYNILTCKIGEEKWSEVSSVINEYIAPHKIFEVEKSVVVVVAGGIIVSHDNKKTWEEYLFQKIKPNGSPYPFYNVIKKSNYLVGVNQLGIFRIKLTDIGITPTSVESETQRNYLYTLPPYPLPTQNEVKVQFYWDINLPMTIEDVSIYDISGREVQTKDKLRIDKQANHYGNLIWDCSGQQAGVYIINIKHGTEEKAVKVVVE